MEENINELNSLPKAILNKPSTNKNFEERSDIAQEIINRKPSFFEKWSLLIFLSIIVILITTTWFIKYPDIINAPAKLTTINAPKPIVSLVSGKLIKLYVRENEIVNEGKILGFLESNANHNEVIKLSDLVDETQKLLDNNSTETLPNLFTFNYSQLGELQQSYQTLSQAYLSLKNYLSSGFYIKKKSMLSKDIFFLQKLRSNLEIQKNLKGQDLSLTQKTFDANESLKKDKVISDFDYRGEQAKLIDKKLTLPQIDASIINNESQQNDKNKEIAELENTINQQKIVFQQAFNTFKSQVDEWKRKYLLVAPFKGKVAFENFVQENQQLQINQSICFINPENTEYFIQIFIPQTNFGKVALGQDVLLKFESYPFQEYGYVKGKIDFISHVPTDSGYLARVILTDGLNTNYKKQILYRDGLIAKAEIVTSNMRLLERFYYNIIKQIKKS
jgi:multidrug efflux pump subunit AcrA (membrane-fusion protein)